MCGLAIAWQARASFLRRPQARPTRRAGFRDGVRRTVESLKSSAGGALEGAKGQLGEAAGALQDRVQDFDLRGFARSKAQELTGAAADIFPAGTSRVADAAVELAAKTAADLRGRAGELDAAQLRQVVAEKVQSLKQFPAAGGSRARDTLVSVATAILNEANRVPTDRRSLRSTIRDLSPDERERRIVEQFCDSESQQELEQVYLPAAYFSERAYDTIDRAILLERRPYGDFEVVGSCWHQGERTFDLDAIRQIAPDFLASVADLVPDVRQYQGREFVQEVSHHIVWGINRRRPDILFIAQRGSSNAGDWLYNLSNYPRPFPSDPLDEDPGGDMVLASVQQELEQAGVTVAYGFWRKYRDIRRGLCEALEDSRRERPEVFERVRRVVFTGHSLGGAAATYMAADALKLLYFPAATSFRTVTFGAPPAADASFYSEFYFNTARNRVPAPLQHTSFWHTRDVVPGAASNERWVKTPGNDVNVGPIRISADSCFGVSPLTAHRIGLYLERLEALRERSRDLQRVPA